MLPLGYQQIKQRQYGARDNYPDKLSLQTHRVLSWLQLYESCYNKLESQFMFQYLAFALAYARGLKFLIQISPKSVILATRIATLSLCATPTSAKFFS